MVSPLLSMGLPFPYLFSRGTFIFLLGSPLLLYWVLLHSSIAFPSVFYSGPLCVSIGHQSFGTATPLFSNGSPFVFLSGSLSFFDPCVCLQNHIRVSAVCFALLPFVFFISLRCSIDFYCSPSFFYWAPLCFLRCPVFPFAPRSFSIGFPFVFY